MRTVRTLLSHIAHSPLALMFAAILLLSPNPACL